MAEHSTDESLWRRSWQDAKAVWTSWPFIVLDAGICGVVGGVFTWYWGVGLFFFAMFCVWIVATASAPIKQRNEARLQARKLEQERVPHISVEPYGGRRTWEWEHEHLMWAELHVTNTSPSLVLNDVAVRIVGCLDIAEETPGNYVLFEVHRWNPTSVYWSIREASSDQLKLPIPPNTKRAALVAFSDDSNGPPAVFNAPTHDRPLLFGGARIEIEVSSPDSAPWKGLFYIQCHPNYVSDIPLGRTLATFEFVTWKTWTANHNVINSLATH